MEIVITNTHGNSSGGVVVGGAVAKEYTDSNNNSSGVMRERSDRITCLCMEIVITVLIGFFSR